MIGFDTGCVVIDLHDVGFSYEDTVVLSGANLHVHPREFVALVGPNGGGKTTLLKLILGLLHPTTGRIRVLGATPEEGRARIGYMPQHARLDPKFPATVMDVVLMGRLGVRPGIGPYRRVDREAAAEALARVDLWEKRSRPLADLSGGQRQRVLIARALASSPEILLLDEPMANLDVQVEFKLYDLLADLNCDCAILLVSHDIGFVSQLVDTVVCVKREVEVHPTSELTGDLVHHIYGGDVKLVRHDHRCAREGHTCSHS